VSENDEVTAQARHKQSREAELEEEISLRTSAKYRQSGCGVTCCGRPFHTCAAATGKSLSKMVDRCVRRTTSDEDGADRRRRRGLRSPTGRVHQQGSIAVTLLPRWFLAIKISY